MNLIEKYGVDAIGLIQRYGGIDRCREIVEKAPEGAECYSWKLGDSGVLDNTVYLDDLRTAIAAHDCDHDWDDISKNEAIERTLICTYCSSIKHEQLQSELNNCSAKDSSEISNSDCCTDNLSHFTDNCTDIRNHLSPLTQVIER